MRDRSRVGESVKDWQGGSQIVSCEGGTITIDGDYKVHTFMSSGNFTVHQAMMVEYLIVGGGGSGGSSHGGGGGAGEYKANNAYDMLVTPGSSPYTVTIGAGGPQTYVSNYGANGGSSSFNSITCIFYLFIC